MYNKRKERNTDHFCHMVCGYFMKDDDLPEHDEDDFEEEEEDIQFLSYQEMNGIGQGKQLYEGRKMKSCQGILKDLDRPNISNKVAAPFHFIDPWWKISILRTRFLTGDKRTRYPKDGTSLTYQIRQDDKVVRDKLVNMFLSKTLSKAEEGQENRQNGNDSYIYIDEFLQYLEHSGNNRRLKFEQLEELIYEFENFLPEDRKLSAEKVLTALKTTEWACISKALKYPKLVSYLSQLLPMQFKAIMENPENDSLVKDLSRALDLKPWVFGFKKLLNKDYDLVGCEAALMSIQRAGLFDDLDQVNKEALIIYDFLKTDSRQHGHTQISLVKLKQKMENECRVFDEALKFLKRHKITKEVEIDNDLKVCLQQLYNYERKISEGINTLYKKQLEDPWELDVDLESEEFDRVRGDKEQLEAAKMLLKYPIVVISGKGGCGKTTVVTKVMSLQREKKEEDKKEDGKEEMSQIDGRDELDWKDFKYSQKTRENIIDPDCPESEMFCSPQDRIPDSEMLCSPQDGTQESKEEDPRDSSEPIIIYTAPTGKAANLLGRRANTNGYTLHQIIWSYKFYVTQKDPDAKWKFRHVKTLVVDECSMVAVSTFSTLLTTLMENSKLRKIVLLGDVRQLPSIEPGNLLADIFKSTYPIKSAVELKTNHRAESNLIIQNATYISEKRYPIFSAEHSFALHEVPKEGNDMHDVVVQRMLKDEPTLQDHTRSQFITFTNKYCEMINEHACKKYNNHTTRNHKNKLDFRIGDKICLKKNGMVVVYEDDGSGKIDVKYLEGDLEPEQAADAMEITLMSQTLDGTSLCETMNAANTTGNLERNESNKKQKKKKTAATIRLCNGEIYFIKDEVNSVSNRGRADRFLKFSDEDRECPRELWVNYKEVMQKCKMKHSWARTIHTFQGSECETLVYVLGFNQYQNWQHVYTAVTRGKKAVHIEGTKYHLQKAIQKDPERRNTTLYHQLHNMLPVEEILDELVSMEESPKEPKFTILKDKENAYAGPSTSLNISSIKPSTSTPLCQRNGLQNFLRKPHLDRIMDSDDVAPRSPLSDSQWSDYGDDTYIEATQDNKRCLNTDNHNNISSTENDNSFDLMNSLDMTENSEINGDLTAACDLLEASMAQNSQITSVMSKAHNTDLQDSFSNYQTKGSKKESNSSADSLSIEEFDSFSSPGSPKKRSHGEDLFTTPKKQKPTKPDVSPTRKMLTQLAFK
ncbi:DNA helicase B-like [Mytilus californianus]|uniref:DNA helicase B-like n=1 Tax=Mytilus californianus TaxID=6549 RepID=UPI002247412F|nr:DNA helicase B-like [Mytilus californianus]